MKEADPGASSREECCHPQGLSTRRKVVCLTAPHASHDKKVKAGGERMQVIHERCAALDVHKKTVVTTIMITQADGSVQEQTRTFLTMTADLLALDDWLGSHGVKVIAMESTGVFWRPVFTLLEEGRQVILVNAQHMKAVPGRKTDVKDSQWLADLLRHGLLKASFIPPKPVRELRDLMRYRKTIVQERADEVNRLQKVLETATIKLASVATDVLGKSGRSRLDALLEGQEDPEILAELARGRLRAKLPDLRKALDGRVRPHHQVLLTRILAHIDFLEESLEQLLKEMEQYLDPFEEAMTLVQSMVGIKETAAASIIAEIGTDMTRFASDKHIASWAGVCPGNKQSGGKRERRQDDQRESLFASDLVRGRLGHCPYQGQLFVRFLSPHGSSTWQTKSDCGPGSQSVSDSLSYLTDQETLHRPGSRLF